MIRQMYIKEIKQNVDLYPYNFDVRTIDEDCDTIIIKLHNCKNINHIFLENKVYKINNIYLFKNKYNSTYYIIFKTDNGNIYSEAIMEKKEMIF